MPATRLMPTQESDDLIELTRDIVDKELRPLADAAERTHTFHREVFRKLGRAGLLSLPYPEEYGGGGQPYEVYLQVLEEIASAWAAVGVGTSVHALSCFGLYHAGTREQKQRLLPDMLGGELLGAYCLSEAHAGSDPAAMRTRAVRDGDEYVINGAKAWTTHGGEADFYKVMARTSDDGGRGISCFLVPAGRARPARRRARGQDGPRGRRPRRRCCSTTYGCRRSGDWGRRGRGCRSPWPALDSGRLGIAAVATGVAQARAGRRGAATRRSASVRKADHRHQGLAFLLADMDAAVTPRALPTWHAARLKRPRPARSPGRRRSPRWSAPTTPCRSPRTRSRCSAGRLHHGLPGRAVHA